LYEAAGQDSLTQRELRQVFTHLADNITVAEKFAPLIADYVVSAFILIFAYLF